MSAFKEEMDSSPSRSNGASSFDIMPEPDSVKMFVGQISRTATEEELRAMFEEFGSVCELSILRDKVTGQSKGCCFLRYQTREAALNAQKALNNIRIMPGMHNAIQMKPADSETRNLEERKLFVGMLPRSYTDTDVRQLFAGLGAVEECTILRDPDGGSKGCAFVAMATKQCAINAIRTLHHSRVLEGAKNPVVVKFADSQKDKDARKSRDMPNRGGSMGGGFGGPMGASGGVGGSGAFGPGGGNNSQYAQQMLQQAMNATGMMGGAANGPQAGAAAAVQQQLLMTALMQMLGGGKPGDPNANLAAMLALMAPALAAGGNNPMLQQFVAAMAGGMATNQVPSMNTPQMGNNPMQSSGGFGVSNQASGAGMSAYDTMAQAYSGMQQFNASSMGQQSHSSSQSSSGNNSMMGGGINRQSEGPDGANLFIYHLPQEFNDNDLIQIFSPFGTIVSSKVFIDRATNMSKCFGFVSYDNAAAAQAAIQAMNGFQMGPRRLKVQLKRAKNDNKPY